MFTGIVEETGRVRSVQPRDDLMVLEVDAAIVLPGMLPGASIAVSGCCLTATAVSGRGFTCELTAETLARTAFASRLTPGALVNLERPLRADGRLDGHIVQGHVDGVGEVVELRRDVRSAELEIAVPPALARYLVEKGSIAVDGISLTVARLLPGAFVAALIPYTLENTALREVRPGGRVNLEADVIAKYVERLLGPRATSGGV
jgi:riboflavin synthase